MGSMYHVFEACWVMESTQSRKGVRREITCPGEQSVHLNLVIVRVRRRGAVGTMHRTHVSI